MPPGEGADADHAAAAFGWNMLILAGNPAEEGSGAMYGEGSEAWFSSPDNVAFDAEGRLWISSDQGGAQAANNIPDGMYCCDVDGAGRGVVKFFFACPKGAEMCGPEFTPDGRTLFVAPQHPAEADGFVSTFENPDTRWPDFAEGMPPRPADRGHHQGRRRPDRQLTARVLLWRWGGCGRPIALARALR